MSKRKGLTLEEKRTRMVEIFMDSMEPFTLKELEKVAPKRKGITSQSVKDVVQSLVDDDMICTDKCGVQVLFWCFPSAAAQQKRARLTTLKEKLSKTEGAITACKEKKVSLAQGRQDTSERLTVVERLRELEEENSLLQEKVATFSSFDPKNVREMDDGANLFKVAANRWTDNIFTIKSYVVNNFGMERAEFDKTFGLVEDFDYLEDS